VTKTRRGPAAKSIEVAPTPDLRHEARLLPNVVLNPRGRYGAACRAQFDGRTLREAADYVIDCDCEPGPTPDSFEILLARRTGTIGAKQAFLAAVADEMGRDDVQLIVACCEMQLSDPGRRHAEPRGHAPQTLPLAVCWLRYGRRRLQMVEPNHASLQTIKLVSEVVVPAHQLAAERVKLYRAFSADWCRALEVEPSEFASLRASQLKQSVGSSVFEDLLGFALAPDYVPIL
jgi:hypothetical protein